jgi:hypothetical protein
MFASTIVHAGAPDQTLVGWSSDGSYYIVHSDQCGMPTFDLCPSKGKTPTWPAKFGAPAAGDDCLNNMTSPALADLDEAAFKKLAPAAGDKKMPAGVTMTLATKKVKTPDGPQVQAIVTVKLAARALTFTVDDVPGASLGPVAWRPDKKAFAVSITNDNTNHCVEGLTHRVRVFDIDLGGDRNGSQAANLRGLAATKKHDYAAANTAFVEAVKLDDSYVFPHYNHASIASIMGDLPAVRAELEWLTKSKDPDAAKLVKKGRDGDPDLDFASTDPDVRRLLGAPAYPADPLKRLSERTGVWSTEADGCEKPAATLKLSTRKQGVAWEMEVTALVCNAKPKVGKRNYQADELFFDMQFPGLGDQPKLTWTRCPGSQVDGSCFTANNRTFHRGVPHAP